jgi:hypothetical protein
MSLISKDESPKANRHWITTVQPTIEPITVEELKLFARIDGTTEDLLLQGFIKSVREATELYLGRALITRTIRMIMDFWPGYYNYFPPAAGYAGYSGGGDYHSGRDYNFHPKTDGVVELPSPPLISVTSVEKIDENDVATTYASTNYFVVTEAIPGYIMLKRGATPPINSDRYHGGIRITFTAGYGAVSSDVPQQILDAMKMWAAALYESRAIITEPPPQARPLLDLYKVPIY